MDKMTISKENLLSDLEVRLDQFDLVFELKNREMITSVLETRDRDQRKSILDKFFYEIETSSLKI